VHVQEVARCQCGQTILTAEGPPKDFERAGYGPGFLANLVVAKCSDSTPLTRLAKQYRRTGVPLNRSTLIDLFHRTAEEARPISDRLVQLVPGLDIAQGDETPLRCSRSTRPAEPISGHSSAGMATTRRPSRTSSARRGPARPARVLGDSKGKFVVDAFSGYNRVTLPGGRVRAGCMAHVRRKFFDALPFVEEARSALDFILQLYKVEAEASERGIVGSDEHRELRQQKSKPVMEASRAWLEA
jgi:transposase